MNKKNTDHIKRLLDMGLSEERAKEIVLGVRKTLFDDVTEAARLLVRRGAKLSLKEGTIMLSKQARGLKTLSAADFVCKTYNLRIINE